MRPHHQNALRFLTITLFPPHPRLLSSAEQVRGSVYLVHVPITGTPLERRFTGAFIFVIASPSAVPLVTYFRVFYELHGNVELQTYVMATSDRLPFPPLRINLSRYFGVENYKQYVHSLVSSDAHLASCRSLMVQSGALRYMALSHAYTEKSERPAPHTSDGMILDGPTKQPRKRRAHAGGAVAAGGVSEVEEEAEDFFD